MNDLFRYGVRAPTEECSLGILLISLQSIVGVVIQVARVEQITSLLDWDDRHTIHHPPAHYNLNYDYIVYIWLSDSVTTNDIDPVKIVISSG